MGGSAERSPAGAPATGVLITDLGGVVQSASDGALGLLGASGTERATAVLAELLDVQAWHLVGRGEPLGRTVMLPDDGRAGRKARLLVSPLRNAAGQVHAASCVLEVGIDVDEPTPAETVEAERLRHMEALIADYAYSLVVEQDGTMRGDWTSESFGRAFGLTLDEIEARGGWQTLVHPEDAKVAIDHAKQVLGGQAHECEMRFVTKDGEPRWLHDRAVPVFDESEQRVVRIHGVSQDITERRHTENALRSSKQFLESVLASIQDGISVLDPKMRVLYVNDVMKRWYRGSLPIVGQPCHQAYHGCDTICDPCPTVRCMQTGHTERDVVPGRADSEVEWLELFSYPHRDPETGEITMVVEFVRDVTEPRRLAAQLQQAQKMEAVGQLAGGVAHDFNNILGVILGRCEMALMVLPPNSKLRGELNEVLRAADRAAGLTRQLLAFSRRQVLQLNEVVTELGSMLGRLLGEQVHLELAPADGLGLVEMDRAQLEQVLMNLAINARDAMPSGGDLTIETANVELDEEYARRHAEVAPGRYVMLAVSDIGTGMAPEVMDHIFEPFFTTKARGHGTGLGLATVEGIVKQSGGHIWVYSEPGQGTTFKIYLPRHAGQLPATPSEPAPVTRRGKGQLVLLVEDEPAVRAFITEALTLHGYQVRSAESAEQALVLARQQPLPRLLLTDVVMGGMSGRQLGDRLQAQIPGLRVVFMSGYTDNAIVHQGALLEGVAFIAKPFTVAELLDKIAVALAD